jgi:uncharacterized repeat protein (TIGR02543 family)
MKKNVLFRLIASVTLALCVAAAFFGCSTDEKTEVTVKSLSVLTQHEGAYYLGDDVDLSEITFTVCYSDDKTKTVVLDDNMISKDDAAKFFTAGAHTITINYGGASCPLQFEVDDVASEGLYLAKFYSLGGTEVKSLATKAVTAFSIPEREGYTFDGWYLDLAYSGDKAVEPYSLTANTSFYAKWIDNRVCSVVFLDSDSSVLYNTSVHYGEKIDVDSYVYPNPTVGKTFTGWNVTNGDADDVTVNLIVKANFITDKCTVSVSYFNTSKETITVEKTYDYGTRFSVADYTLPTKEGYSSRWVVYCNHAEDTDENAYSEISDDFSVTLTEKYTSIKPKYDINTYDILIYNGKAKALQLYADLKSGVPALERIYENSAASKNFRVEWNTDFRFSDYTQNPKLDVPTSIEGYTAQWCFVVTDGTGNETWYTASGWVWDGTVCDFVKPEYGENEGETNWTLRDADGKYTATVKNQVLTAVKGSVTVKAKYVKKEYTVTVSRMADNTSTALVTFGVKYYSDFNVYSSLSYLNYSESKTSDKTKDVTYYYFNSAALKNKAADYDLKNADKAAIEQFYLLENTDYAVKKLAAGFYNTGETNDDFQFDDWSVDWYSLQNLSSESEVDFIGGTDVEITGETRFFCKDTDNRKYETYFFYGYDFDKKTYDTVKIFTVAEKETVTVPSDSAATISGSFNGVSLSYEFLGWFETPYRLYLETGYRGSQLTNFTTRKASTYYYAHYVCNTTYNVSIFDTTQSVAYIGNDELSGEGSFLYTDYSVAENTISYTLPAGTLFSMDMIYKGTSYGTSSVVSGQTYYENYLRNLFYSEQYQNAGGLKEYIDGKFASGETKKASEALSALMTAYSNAVSSVYTHDYSEFTFADYTYLLTGFAAEDKASAVDDFNVFYGSLASDSRIKAALDNAGYTSALMDKIGDLDTFITEYLTRLLYLYEHGFTTDLTGFEGLTQYIDTAFSASSDYGKIAAVIHILDAYTEFSEKYSETAYTEKTVTPKYGESKKYLNMAYGFDIENGEEKYSFSGWYGDAAYTGLYQTDFAPLDFVVRNDVTLYAKWTDVTKGTEGLVYEEAVTDTNERVYVVIDFTNGAQYVQTGYSGEYYYVTTDDNGTIPVKISGDIDLQIPATIDKYLDKTAEAATKQAAWSTEYKNYYVLSGIAYVQASAAYSASETYYRKETYPVIGIASSAFGRYAGNIVSVTIPLNLYFIEDGAFRLTAVKTFTRMAAKTGESAEDYVVLDGNCAIYQWTANKYPSVTGCKTGMSYGANSRGRTIKAYATASETTEYAFLSGTEEIGASAFFNATNLTSVNGVADISVIGDEAFEGASAFVSYGDTAGKIIFPAAVTKIGDKAFYQCGKAADISADGNAALSIGASAFEGTNWYNDESHRGIISLRYNVSGTDTGIILGYYAGTQADCDTDNGDFVRYDINGNIDADGGYYGISAEDTIVLYKIGEGKPSKVIINFDVAAVCEGAFKSIEAPEIVFKSVKKIGDYAFDSCQQLSTVKIVGVSPFGGATLLGENVFNGHGEDNKVTITFGSESVRTTVTNDTSWNSYTNIEY